MPSSGLCQIQWKKRCYKLGLATHSLVTELAQEPTRMNLALQGSLDLMSNEQKSHDFYCSFAFLNLFFVYRSFIHHL